MPRVRVNYEGWIALPAAVRQRFGINTGDQLEIEIANGSIVLRPASGPSAADCAVTEAAFAAARAVVEAPAPTAPEPEIAQPEAAASEPAAILPPPVKRSPGRPRKIAVAALPPTLKTRGRRPSTKA
jgi:AbrB family looped-hinge helix DNA binding protein